jgi:hypothetical protein
LVSSAASLEKETKSMPRSAFLNGRLSQFRNEFKLVEKILTRTPAVNKKLQVETKEFVERQKKVAAALRKAGLDVGFVFSDEHYDGDVPYLGGNTNIGVEQVAGVIGPKGFHITAGLEGGYVAEQLAWRAKAFVHKVELLQLADEKYPIRAERIEDVLEAAAGKPLKEIRKIGLLTPRQVSNISRASSARKTSSIRSSCINRSRTSRATARWSSSAMPMSSPTR